MNCEKPRKSIISIVIPGEVSQKRRDYDKVIDGVAEVVESTIEGHDYEESEYEVEEVIDESRKPE